MEIIIIKKNVVRYHQMAGGDEKKDKIEGTRERREGRQSRARTPSKNHYKHG